jgi:hypothetical protein
MMPPPNGTGVVPRSIGHREVAMLNPHTVPGIGSNPAARGRLLALLLPLLLLTAPGCETRRDAGSADGTQAEGDAKVADGASSNHQDEPAGSGTTESGSNAAGSNRAGHPAGTTSSGAATTSPGVTDHRVRLVQKGCVQFEPRWPEIEVGTSLTWESELPSSVTILLPPGVFARSEFTIPPGGSVKSGPALKAGTFPLRTDPTACQEVPRGVRGSGPGVAVHAAGGH